MKEKNEIEAVGTETNRPAMLTADAFKASLQGALGLSPLAVGEKFESDDLVKADKVTLWEFDWVDYTKNEGKPDEENVHFALWRVTVENKGDITEGYYQGGVVLNKLATHIQSENIGEELSTFGVEIRAEWDKTSSGNKILKITVV